MMKRFSVVWVMVFVAVQGAAVAASPSPGSCGRYRALPGGSQGQLAFHIVDVTYGPAEVINGKEHHWWQLDVYAKPEADGQPLLQLRALTSRDPLADPRSPMLFARYQLHVPSAEETLEYRNVHTGMAQLPRWGRFTEYFVPKPVRGTNRRSDLPHTCAYLGHILSLREVKQGQAWAAWDEVTVLDLDSELWLGTGRTVKDSEGKRLPQEPEPRNYNYVRWTKDDYATMIDAGINLFALVPGIEPYLRTRPVFYRKSGRDMSYPADLYRSNCLGPKMYMDEPTCRMTGDDRVYPILHYFTDAAALITNRLRAGYLDGVYEVEDQLKKRDIALGDMRVAHYDFASWETRYETAFYQLEGGGAGFVHEGRYQLDEFTEFAEASTGLKRDYTPEEMFEYYYAFMRGAARHFGKDWGTAIYGQADPELNPIALKMAYDMGARYLWWWTSDHGHHVPWVEQVAMARLIQEHAKANPRPSIRGPMPVLDKVFVVPYGYIVVLESPTNRKNCWDLWWVREMDPEGRNEMSQRYDRLRRNLMQEVHKAFDAGESFDIIMDDGRPIAGYDEVIHVDDKLAGN